VLFQRRPLLLFSSPINKVSDLWVRKQFFNRIEVLAKCFLRLELVYGLVAVAAKINGLLHPLAREVLLKPLVTVASAWDEMMGCKSAAEYPAA